MSTFLYKVGDECIDITGGFISCPYTLTGTSVNVIKNSDNIQLNPNGKGRYTSVSHNTAIDLTEYKSIYFDIEVVSTLGANQWARLGISVNNNQNDYGVGEVTIENQVGRKLYCIDLTNKTGLAFVKAHINSGTGAVSPFINIKIYNIWLEGNLEKLSSSSSLVDSVDYIKNVNDEIYSLKAKLENNLITKGVECSRIDKMSSLIDKVNNISLESLGGRKWASGVLNYTKNTNVTSIIITHNSDFTPTLALAIFESYWTGETTCAYVGVSNLGTMSTYNGYTSATTLNLNLNTNTITFSHNGSGSMKGDLYWYVFE